MTTADFNADDKPDLAVANSDSNTVSVLLGDGSPEPVAAPTSLSFASQALGTLSSAQSVTVTNSTPGYPLLVNRVQTTGTDRDDFIVSTDDCSAESVPSAGSCEVRVRFAPSAAGAKERHTRDPPQRTLFAAERVTCRRRGACDRSCPRRR